MTEYESVYMELRGCTFDVKLPQESVTAIIQSMMDKTTLVCSTRAPKKICANCKHWEVGYDGLGDCSKSSLGIVYYKESCDKWESI